MDDQRVMEEGLLRPARAAGASTSHHPMLVCQAGALRCALPLDTVEETMRPLPVKPLAGVPAFVRGVAVVRGQPTPVVDAAMLLGGETVRCARFVRVRAGSRPLILAVSTVTGVVNAPSSDALPPLLARSGNEAIDAIGVLDAELLLVLRRARLIPDHVWASLDGAAPGDGSTARGV